MAVVQEVLYFIFLSSVSPFRTGFVTQKMSAGVELQVGHMFKHTTQWHTVDREQEISRGYRIFL